MGFLLALAAVVPAVIALLWWVDRRNPGTFRGTDNRAEDHMETRRDWGPR